MTTRYIILLTMSLLMLFGESADAGIFQKNRSSSKKTTVSETKSASDSVTPRRVTPYERLFRGKKAESFKGMITIHKIGAKLYFEFPLDLLNRDFLIGTTVCQTSDNGNALVGQKPVDPLHVRFTIRDSTLYMLEASNPTRPDIRSKDLRIQEAVTKTHFTKIRHLSL